MPKKCDIKGTIISSGSKWIYNWLGIPATSPKDVEDALKDANGEDIEFAINSGGGDVYAGSEMFTLIKKYPGNTSAEVLGIAASAASLPLCAVKTAKISPTAQVMIHNAASNASGDHRAMQHSADVLKGWNDSISNAYTMKTGMSKDALLELMNNETWLTAKRAKELGFVDEIMFEDVSSTLVAAAGDTVVLPDVLVNKLQTLLTNEMLKTGSLPNNKGDYKDLLNSVQKGDDQMNFTEILATLPEGHQSVILAALEASKAEGKNEAENTFKNEKGSMQKIIDDLKKTSATNNVEDEEAILANVDPKIKAMIDAAKQREATAKADAVQAQMELQKVNDAKEIAEFTNTANSFDKLPINASEFAPIFKNFAKADKEGFEKLTAMLKAVNNCVEAGKIFNSAGQEHTADAKTAWDEVQNLVTDEMKKDTSLTNHAALVKVFQNNASLYERYVAEQNNFEDEAKA